jgi:tyrosine-protein phosphatase SIW14
MYNLARIPEDEGGTEAVVMRTFRIAFGLLIAVMLLATPIAYAYYRNGQIRNLRVVREGVLYRSGQLSLEGLKTVIHDCGIKTVISLRPDDKNPPPDWQEEEYCYALGVKYCRIPPRVWAAPGGGFAPAQVGVDMFREILDDPAHHPVLIHCYAGIHRTGAFCAIYRMEYEHWHNDKAIAEMRDCGYKDLEDEWDLLSYLQDYRPRWKK